MTTRAGTILLVDDDIVNRQLLSMLFVDAGYSVLEAATGRSALQQARQRPDVIVLDVNLPDFSGFEVCRQIKADPALRSISVIHLSAVFVDSEDRSQGLEGGADAYLIKPVDHRELKATVQALLRIRAAEEAARQAAHEWQTTFDAISDGVCLVGPDALIRRGNLALAQLLDPSVDSAGKEAPPENGFAGRSLTLALTEGVGLPYDALAPLLDAIAQGQRYMGDLDTSGTDRRTFQITAGPILDDDQQLIGSVVILSDITQRRLLEKQAQQGQQLEAIGRLAAGIAHEFNNLLTSIVGNASILLNGTRPGSSERQLIESINASAWRAADLTSELLGFARQSLLWLRPIHLAPVFSELVRQVGSPPGIRLVITPTMGLWPIQGDPDYLVQKLRRLCQFGIERMPRGGTLSVDASNVEFTADNLPVSSEARPGKFVLLQLRDQGGPLDEETATRLFEPFGGQPLGQAADLGLAMVHGLVKQHRGWIECHPESNGTRFDIYLPHALSAEFPPTGSGERNEARESPEPALTTAAVTSKGRVLLAEENETLRRLAAAYLHQAGFEPLLASDFPEAIELFQQRPQAVDALVLPQSMLLPSTSEALSQFKEMRPGLAVVLACPSSQEQEGTSGEVDATIRRPYLAEEVHTVLTRVLQQGEKPHPPATD